MNSWILRQKCVTISDIIKSIPLVLRLQVLERDGWTGLEEVTRMLNGHEFAVTGKTSGLNIDTEMYVKGTFEWKVHRGKGNTQSIPVLYFLLLSTSPLSLSR